MRLDRNQKQSRIEERMLERNMAHPERNAQSRGRGSYGAREEQITWRTEGGGGNMFNRGGTQIGPRRDPNAMDIDREGGGDRICYVCGKWDHMAKNCWKRHKERIVEMPQESAKENGGQ